VTARSHRVGAKVAAAAYVATCCPWATGHRVTTGRPSAACRWRYHHAIVAVKLRDGTEYTPVAVGETDRCDSEAAALDALTTKLRAAQLAGGTVPDPWEAAQRGAFGPPPDWWASWGAMPDDLRHRLAAERLASGGRRFSLADMVREAPSSADLRALGLTTMPTPVELAAAWRKTVARTHPDHGGSEVAFIAAKAAHERLRAVTP
jgi:hypothetical protein